MSKEQIENLEGSYDDDGFYILADGSFYDPLGYFFDKDGKDAKGGFYNGLGFYIDPSIPQKPARQLGKAQIETLEGRYDQDGFYILKEGGFYDSEGFFFDKDGYDALGGWYNRHGEYVSPDDGDDQDRRDQSWQEDYYAAEGSVEGEKHSGQLEESFEQEECEEPEDDEANDDYEDEEKEFFAENDTTSLPVQAMVETHLKPAKVFIAQQL